MSRLLILIPTLDERANIEEALRRVSAALPGAHVLVIDDASTDGTIEAAEAMKAEVPALDIMVRRDGPVGLGYAIRDGYAYALDSGFDEVCIVDCDLQQDPADVQKLREADPSADIVVGSRYARGPQLAENYDPLSKWLSIASNLGTRLMFGLRCTDITTDFFLVRRRVLERVPPRALRAGGHAFFAEVKVRAHQAGFRIAEVPVSSQARRADRSKRSWRHVWMFAREILRLRLSRKLVAGPGNASREKP